MKYSAWILAAAATYCAIRPTYAEAARAPDPAVLEAQAARVVTVEAISKPTIAIFDTSGQGGGSGVVISSDGYALTNFHVTAPCGPAMKVGLADGRFVDAVLVGLDPGGDVALIKLIGEEEFPAAELGDSDTVRVGDWTYVVGNPFLLADDFKPTVTYGIISGVHRYQYPAGTLLEYADCLQTDAAINPGNSGGPLFDASGKLIGINGRGSFEKRGRVNVGVGYAISINQIKKFLGQLRSGRVTDHATLGATVSRDGGGRVVVDDILENSDAFRRGLRYGDEIVEFGGREISSPNQFKNVLGTFPSGWRVRLTYRRDGHEYERRVRLAGAHREGELEALLKHGEEIPDELPEEKPGEDEPNGKEGDDPEPQPRRRVASRRVKAELPEKVKPYYEAARGYANYWFNRYHQQRVWNAYLARGDFAEVPSDWTIRGRDATGSEVEIELTDSRGSIVMPAGKSEAVFGPSLSDTTSPPRSGGLLSALHLWQRLVLGGLRQFGDVQYFGTLPWNNDEDLADCLIGIRAGVETRFYFDPRSGNLVGIEMFAADDLDPCEIYFDDFREVEGRTLPHHWKVRHGDEVFADLTIESYDWSIGKE